MPAPTTSAACSTLCCSGAPTGTPPDTKQCWNPIPVYMSPETGPDKIILVVIVFCSCIHYSWKPSCGVDRPKHAHVCPGQDWIACKFTLQPPTLVVQCGMSDPFVVCCLRWPSQTHQFECCEVVLHKEHQVISRFKQNALQRDLH